MFLQWCRDGLVLSFIFVQRLVSWNRTRPREGTTSETQTLAAIFKMKIESIKLLNFGQLTTDEEEQEDSKNSPSGYFLRPETIKFTGTTDKIKGMLGVRFGIQYFIKGFMDDKDEVSFICKISHPTMIHPRTKEQIESVTEIKTNYLNENNFDYFHFEFDCLVLK